MELCSSEAQFQTSSQFRSSKVDRPHLSRTVVPDSNEGAKEEKSIEYSETGIMGLNLSCRCLFLPDLSIRTYTSLKKSTGSIVRIVDNAGVEG